MARQAKPKAEEVQVVNEPDYDRAVKVMLNDIKAQSDKSATARGNLSAAWKIIEDDCRVNKRAAKVFESRILNADDETRDDFLRSLYGLMKTSNIDISEDLVDKAEGNGAPTMPTKAKASGLANLAIVGAESVN